ncbi:amidohydrolase [Janibacter sp. G1551]|uniref:amidohydrolase n=1 Tax=Janibacter sp. G1551 TaxID=3420440 RepID=UPI003D0404A7
MTTTPLTADVLATLDALLPELIGFRRDLHAHPELSREEVRTAAAIADRLRQAGLTPVSVCGTAVVADIGAHEASHRIALRADIDALPVQERTGLDWSSTTRGVCHACGHDVHTAIVLGVGLVLATLSDDLAAAGVGVRLIFQHAEERIPGGAHDLLEAGVMEGVDSVFALHCDPSIDVGQVGLREGAITAACDSVTVHVTGKGGHTSRPHLTEDLTFALAKVVTEVPAALSRRIDPRAGFALVWGRVEAGVASNVIPSSGVAAGTLRILDASAWDAIGDLLEQVIEDVVAPYGVRTRIEHVKGVPPVVNRGPAIAALGRAARAVDLTPVPTAQSMGGEDFSWLMQDTPGALARLGTRTPGGPTYDLHQGDLIVDEGAIRAGAALLIRLVLDRGALG